MPHPLDPLSELEITTAVAVVRSKGGLSAQAWFETVALQEPTKVQLRDGTARRQAFVCCYDPVSGQTWDGTVDLATEKLREWRHVAGAQARIIIDEFLAGAAIAKADPRFVAACAKRGITDMSKVLVESWAAGHFGHKEDQGERLAYCHAWVMNDANDNPYAKPIAHLHPVVDLRRMKVVRIDDFGVVPMPPERHSISNSRMVRASRSMGGRSAGRSGSSVLASMCAMA
jgi:primary-amine oxidase